MKYELKPCSDFGKNVKIKLLEMNKTQNWLIERLRTNLPNMCIDGSLLHRILVGKVKNGKVVDEIHKILEI